jgi:hypothetical protein
MAYADDIRAADTVTLDTIADSIEALWTSAGALAWTSWTPTTGASGGTWGTITSSSYYSVVGDLTICFVHIYGTAGATPDYLTFTLPSNVAYTTHCNLQLMEGGITVIVPASCVCASGTATVSVYRYDDVAISDGTVRGPSGIILYKSA